MTLSIHEIDVSNYVEIRLNSNSPDYKFNTNLGGIAYQIHLNYKYRFDAWYIGISAVSGEDIILNQRIDCPQTFTLKNKTVNAPGGTFFFIDTSKPASAAKTTITRQNIGSTVRLYYVG